MSASGECVWKITGIAKCSSLIKTDLKLTQPICIEGMGKEYADADEDEECRYSLCHSFPPCVAMPERACLRNSR
jgi:hypothetical protein